MKCKICNKEKIYRSEYCCRQHWLLDRNRYSGESIRETVERHSRQRKARLLKLK